MTKSPLSDCPFAKPRILRQWWRDDILGIASQGVIGHVVGTRLWWWDPAKFDRWLMENSYRRAYSRPLPVQDPAPRIKFTPRKKKQTGAPTPA